MFLRKKKKLKIDLGDLKDKKEALSSFMHSKFKIDITLKDNNVLVDSKNCSSKELKRMVNKFVYHQNQMNKYWVALEKDVVKINKYKRAKKKKKQNKDWTPPSIIKHGW